MKAKDKQYWLTDYSVQSWSSQSNTAPMLMPLTEPKDIENACWQKDNDQSVRGSTQGTRLGGIRRKGGR